MVSSICAPRMSSGWTLAGARVKDKLERFLHDRVCDGSVRLSGARRAFRNWRQLSSASASRALRSVLPDGILSNAMSKENVDAARRLIDAWNRGDVEAYVNSFHPQIEWFSAVMGRMQGAETVYRGHEGIRRFWDEWHSVWDLTIEISEYRDLGDTVLSLGRIRARGKASGVDLDVPVAYVGEAEGGLVRKLRAYLDPNEALEALGLSE
jgi:ketosteroid isomerase-like protein